MSLNDVKIKIDNKCFILHWTNVQDPRAQADLMIIIASWTIYAINNYKSCTIQQFIF